MHLSYNLLRSAKLILDLVSVNRSVQIEVIPWKFALITYMEATGLSPRFILDFATTFKYSNLFDFVDYSLHKVMSKVTLENKEKSVMYKGKGCM